MLNLKMKTLAGRMIRVKGKSIEGEAKDRSWGSVNPACKYGSTLRADGQPKLESFGEGSPTGGYTEGRNAIGPIEFCQ